MCSFREKLADPLRFVFFTPALCVFVLACGEDERAVPDVPICDRLTSTCARAPAAAPAMSEPVTMVPSNAMPREVVSQLSHNNLDIIWFGGRLYFAFRTAPHHFASTQTVMYVVSSDDMDSWQLETKIAIGRDVREPRFLAVGGRLFLYFAVLGDNPLTFQPEGTRVVERRASADWTTPEPILEPGFIGWRARSVGDEHYLIGYVGGENIYQGAEPSLQIYWLKTRDGRHFEPAVPGHAIVEDGGGSETDFAFLEDGSLVAVTRNELGDEDRWGSKICRAEASDLGNWSCKADPKKYDSPLLFRQGASVYLIARRQLAHDGNFDLFQTELSVDAQGTAYNAEYWKTPKRCSLWKVDPLELEVSFVMDLPSRGDTCFASAVPLQDRSWLVFNYTSALDGEDLSWLDGQQNATSIYSLALTVP